MFINLRTDSLTPKPRQLILHQLAEDMATYYEARPGSGQVLAFDHLAELCNWINTMHGTNCKPVIFDKVAHGIDFEENEALTALLLKLEYTVIKVDKKIPKVV